MTTRSARSEGLPFVLVNMAMTADGKIATTNRAISSFGSQRDRDHLLELRSTVDAVMCGARTAATPGVNMGPGPAKYRRKRLARGLSEYNLRVIVSGSGRMPPDADVLKHTCSPVILLASHSANRSRVKRLETAGCTVKMVGESEVDLKSALRWLKRTQGVDRLLCEGGGELDDAMFRAGLVNEVHLTVCPFVFGGRKAPTIAEGTGFPSLAECAQLELRAMKRKGDEVFLVYSCLPFRRQGQLLKQAIKVGR